MDPVDVPRQAAAATGPGPFRAIPTRRRDVVQPLAGDTYKVQFTLSAAGYQKLRRAQDLLRHSIPNGDVAAVVERALRLLVEDIGEEETRRGGSTSSVAPGHEGARDVSPRPCDEKCGAAMAGSARLWARTAAARNAVSSSCTTSCRLQTAVRPRWTMSNSGVAPTTSTRRRCGSAAMSFGSAHPPTRAVDSVRTEFPRLTDRNLVKGNRIV